MKLILKKAFILMCCIASIKSLYAQQDPLFSQYAFNTLSINPAYSGTKQGISAAAISRFQWVGFDGGAPITHSVVLHSPVAQQVGLGASITYDIQGPTTQLYVNADAAYHLPIDRRSNLSFGLKLGFAQFRTDFNELIIRDESDQILTGVVSEIKPNIGAGAYYYSDKMYVGFSIPRMLKSEFTENIQELQVYYYVIAGYVARVSQSIQLRPTVLLRASEGVPYHMDISPAAIFHDRFLVGLTYRFTPEIGAVFQYWLDNGVKIGYAYDYPLNVLNTQTMGSHEIMLGLDLNAKNKKKKVYSPRFF